MTSWHAKWAKPRIEKKVDYCGLTMDRTWCVISILAFQSFVSRTDRYVVGYFLLTSNPPIATLISMT